MTTVSDYEQLGFTQVVIVESESYRPKHRYDTDKTYETIIASKDGAYCTAHFTWQRSRDGARGHHMSDCEAITQERYAELKKKAASGPITRPLNIVRRKPRSLSRRRY